MKPFLLFTLLTIFCCTAKAQSNIFAGVDISTTTGCSLFYSYAIKGKIGIGVGAAIPDLDNVNNVAFSILGDFRYYLKMGRHSVMPFLQIGKYMYAYDAISFGTHTEIHGNLHIAPGVSYSYRLWGKSGGPFIAVSYRSIIVNTHINGEQSQSTSTDLVGSMGIKVL
jgi:hypothetical protein